MVGRLGTSLAVIRCREIPPRPTEADSMISPHLHNAHDNPCLYEVWVTNDVTLLWSREEKNGA